MRHALDWPGLEIAVQRLTGGCPRGKCRHSLGNHGKLDAKYICRCCLGLDEPKQEEEIEHAEYE